MANCLRAVREARRDDHRLRSAESDRRRRRRRADAGPGNESFVGQFPIPMRHGMTIGELARLFNEHFAIKAPLEVVTMEGWSRDAIRRSDRAAVGDAVAEHPDARQRRRLSGHGAVRRHHGVRRDAARRGRSSWSARRGSRPSASPTDERAGSCPACISAPRSSSRRSRSTRRTTCGGCQIHVLDRQAFRPVLTGVALIEAITARRPGGVRVAAAALRVRARKGADRHPRRLAGALASRRKKGRDLVPVLGTGEQAVEEVRAEYLRVSSRRAPRVPALRLRHGHRAKILDVTRTQLIQAPPARVMQAFFREPISTAGGG